MIAFKTTYIYAGTQRLVTCLSDVIILPSLAIDKQFRLKDFTSLLLLLNNAKTEYVVIMNTFIILMFRYLK
jgi:hypothetical protein